MKFNRVQFSGINKFLKVLFFGSLLMTIACKKTFHTKDGKLPKEAVKYAKKFMGSYSGEYLGETATVKLSLVEREVKIELLSNHGQWLSPDCHSKVGDLYKVKSIKSHKKFKEAANGGKLIGGRAYFDFDPGHCEIDGRTLKLYFDVKKPGQLKTEILIEERYKNYCWESCNENRCSESCVPVDRSERLFGHFTKD